MDETGIIDLTAQTLTIDGQVLPIVWWGDADREPCVISSARYIDAGPDSEGYFYQMMVPEYGKAIQ